MNFWNNNINWFIVIIILLIYFIITQLICLRSKSYSSIKQLISVLGNKKNSISFLFNIWLIILGLLICIIAIDFYIIYESISKPLSTLGYWLIFSFGIGSCIISGLFHYDEEKIFINRASTIHTIFAGIGIASCAFIPLIISLLYFKLYIYLNSLYCIILFVINLVLLTITALGQMKITKNVALNLLGLWQRLLLICSYTSLLMLAVTTVK